MSFDLYFLSKGPDETWEDAVEALEENAADERPLAAADLELWRRLESKLHEVLPAAEVFEGDRNRALTDEASGIEFSLFPGELSLSVPYWYDGPEAERLVGVLRQIAEIVEAESGLIAFDPQADAPFLEESDGDAARTFDFIHESLANQGIKAIPSTKPKSRWRRLLGR